MVDSLLIRACSNYALCIVLIHLYIILYNEYYKPESCIQKLNIKILVIQPRLKNIVVIRGNSL